MKYCSNAPRTNGNIGPTIRAAQNEPDAEDASRPPYAPSVKNAPCARLRMFIKPKISVRPAASRKISMLSCSPFRSWKRKSCMRLPIPTRPGDSERLDTAGQIVGAFELVDVLAFQLAVDPLDDLDYVDLVEKSAVRSVE